MKVLKFGGTSVGTVKSLTHVKRIVESEEEPVIELEIPEVRATEDDLIAQTQIQNPEEQ